MDVVIKDLDAKGLRHFAFTVGAAIAIIFGLALPWLFGFSYPRWPWVVAGILALWGAIHPASLGPVYKGWMKGSLLIGKVTTPLVLGIVFVLLILPIGLLFRIFGRDAMGKRFHGESESYRNEAEAQSAGDLERPF